MMTAGATDLLSYDAEIFGAIVNESRRQANAIELIPSENYTHPEVSPKVGHMPASSSGV